MTNRYFYDPAKPGRLAAIEATDAQIETNEETFRSEDIGGGGGGGFVPARNVGQCSLAFTVVQGPSVTPLEFTFDSGDAGLLDISTPTAVLPVEAGVYAYTLTVIPDELSTLGYTVLPVVDDDWYSIHPNQGKTLARTVTSVVWYSDAGSPFHVSILAAEGEQFDGSLYVQRIT